MAQLVFYSQTGQTRKYVNKIKDRESIEINPNHFDVEMTEPFIFLVPSYESNVHPDVIDTCSDFLETGDNILLCKGMFAGGNRNFAQLFCITAKELSEEYKIPILHEFEFQGSKYDLSKLEEELQHIDNKN